MSFHHGFPFDPTYGYGLSDLLAISPPPESRGFVSFWTRRYQAALTQDPAPQLTPSGIRRSGFRVHDLAYRSTGGFRIRGWLLEPRTPRTRCALVLGHGYGGVDQPPSPLPLEDAIYLIPCFRGLCLSRRPPISEDPYWHVVHDIQDRDRYILGGCVDDLWVGVTTLLRLYPQLSGRIGYAGISFGGGVGALALPWDRRVARGHLNVPSFGHQPLRLQLPTVGSADSIQRFEREHGHVLDTLTYYDAAVAARHIRQPMHVAAALFDPAVAPPGQFAIYNAIPGEKRLYLLEAGHFDYPNRERQERELLAELRAFFGALGGG
jgi:cephalosporin-C deacetylase